MFELYNDTDKELLKKWKKVIESQDAAPVKKLDHQYAMARMLENTSVFLRSRRDDLSSFGEATPTTVTGGIAKWEPIVISMVRRMGPTLLGSQFYGTQPMTSPSGLAFAIRPRYGTQVGTEVYDKAPKAHFTGANSAGNVNVADLPFDVQTNPLAVDGVNPLGSGFTTGGAMATATGEGDVGSEFSMTVDKVTVEAKTRSTKANYSEETAQDLASQHGISADALFTGLLSDQLAAETNYELLRKLYYSAVLGCTDTVSPGTYDLDTDSSGGWIAEKARTLAVRILHECSEIMAATRYGHGNYAIVDRKTYNLLHSAGLISDYGPSNSMFNGDDPIIRTNVPASGVLFGSVRIFRDDYANVPGTDGFVLVGYKGASELEAPVYFCPYVPVWNVRTVDPASGQPRIFFKTRYGIVANPLVDTNGAITARSNKCLRIFRVANIEI